MMYNYRRVIPMVNLKGRDFLKLLDFTSEEIEYLVDLAADLKAKKKAGIPHRIHEGKNVALIFEKTSTRTRCSFEVGIEYRGYGQDLVEELAKYASVPVWNGLTNEFHPTQILADFLTIKEQFGHLKGINFVYMGDARYNMGNSLMVGCAKMGINFTACAPKKYFPDHDLVDTCKAIAKENGCEIKFSENPTEAVKDANVIYTDVWVSMGEPMEVWKERIDDLMPYQVNQKLMDAAADDVVFMHCLPAYHDHKTKVGREIGERFGCDALEVTDEVFESERSIVFREAENRMHTIKAVMAAKRAKLSASLSLQQVWADISKRSPTPAITDR